MGFAELAVPLLNLGGAGLLMAYLAWDRSIANRRQLQRDKAADEKQARAEAREDKKIEAEKALAVSLALLTEGMKGGR